MALSTHPEAGGNDSWHGDENMRLISDADERAIRAIEDRITARLNVAGQYIFVERVRDWAEHEYFTSQRP